MSGRAPHVFRGSVREEASLEDSPHPPRVLGSAATSHACLQCLGRRRRPRRSLARGRPGTPEGGETGEPSEVLRSLSSKVSKNVWVHNVSGERRGIGTAWRESECMAGASSWKLSAWSRGRESQIQLLVPDTWKALFKILYLIQARTKKRKNLK